jgi:hypothetical protein
LPHDLPCNAASPFRCCMSRARPPEQKRQLT